MIETPIDEAAPAARLAELEAALQPILACARELVQPLDPRDSWKIGIPDSQTIFGFVGAKLTAGELRRVFALCADGKAP